MENSKLERVHALINKLLAVTVDNGATEAEAITATLKVQEILAKYDMELSDVGAVKEDIVEETVETSNDKWRLSLAVIVAENFCTKVWVRDGNIVFYGYKRHCEVARDVFANLYNFGRNRSKIVFKEYRDAGYNVNGIKNQFYVGFLHGVKSALDVQSRALAIVTPTEVEEAYKNVKFNGKKKNTGMTYRRNTDVYNRGYSAGREAASKKELETT